MYDFFGPYDEQVAVGAFAETLAADPDVPLVIDHTSSRRIARTGNAASPLILTEVTEGDTTGLLTHAPSLQMSDPDTAYIVPKLQSELIDEMSFRFMITAGRWSEDFMTYTIAGVDIDRGDVSIVGYGANPHTQGAGMRSKRTPEQERDRFRALALLEMAEADRDPLAVRYAGK
jgi:HK97 family phage prohead protease